MIDARVFLGLPLCYAGRYELHPLLVKDVLTNQDIIRGYRLLVQSQGQIDDLMHKQKEANPNLTIPTPLEFLLINMYHTKEFHALIQQTIKAICHCECDIDFLNKKIILLNEHKYIIEEANFFEFQQGVRQIFGEDPIEPPSDDPAVRKKQFLDSMRERIANKGKTGISLTTTLSAICCMGIGLTPLNIGEISYAAVNQIMEMYQRKEKYQIDIESLIAGADPKKVKPQYWIGDKSDIQWVSM